MAVITPIRPDWDLDDPEFAPDESEDDYEFVDPDAVPTEWEFGTPVGPI